MRLDRLRLRGFQYTYRFDRRLRQRFTAAGRFVLAGAVIAGVTGINTHVNLAIQMFTLLLALLLAGLIANGYFRPSLRIRRRLPPLATAGQPARYTLQIENGGDRLQRGLMIGDELQEDWPTVEAFRRFHDPDDGQRNRFDRRVGYPRWLHLVRRQRGADTTPVELPLLPPGRKLELTLELRPHRRGRLHFRGYRLLRPDPLGLINALVWRDAPDSLLVLPKRYPVPRLRLSGGRQYQPGGFSPAHGVGDSQDFFSLRDYRVGDPIRHIHWKSWAKTGKPIVRENRPEYFSRYALVLDTAVPAGGEWRFEEAVAVAASLLCAVDTGDALLDLLFLGPDLYQYTVGRGLEDSLHLLKILAGVEGTDEAAFDRLGAAVVQQSGQFSACVLVLLEWDARRRQLVESLQRRGKRPLALVMTETPAPELQGLAVSVPVDQVAESLQRLGAARIGMQ
jgi:uncharacterized protein (DUF58 family)